MRRSLLAPLVAIGLLISQTALAQRTEENVTTDSEDAFGRSVGNESIGIYNEGDVRGFSPIEAGNVRVEGLYFDRLGHLTSRLVEGSTIRVGIASQSYPFPSPTGIVDYDLRRVGGKQVISALANYGPFGGLGAEVDAQLPIIGEELGIALGAGIYRDAFPWGGEQRSDFLCDRAAVAADGEPRAAAVLQSHRVQRGGVRAADADGRAACCRRRSVANITTGSEWSTNEGEILNYGVIGAMRFGAWTARLGAIRIGVLGGRASSPSCSPTSSRIATRTRVVVAFPDSRFASKSGELRLSRVFEDGQRRHTLQFAARGRLQKRRYGGEDEIEIGQVELGVGRDDRTTRCSRSVSSRTTRSNSRPSVQRTSSSGPTSAR